LKIDEGLTGIQLCEYLSDLRSILEKRGFGPLAERVAHVGRFASGSSSEFFGEAVVLLRDSKKSFFDALTEDEFRLMNMVLERIEIAFRRVGGN
jgi:hypothetical protein